MTNQIIYTPENSPTKGVAKKIWNVLVANNLDPQDLHYNGGRRGVAGGGTWACVINDTFERRVLSNRHRSNGTRAGEFWCGILGRTAIYLEEMTSPYDSFIVGFATRKCPFRTRTGCSYYSLTNRDGIQEDDCPATCDAGTDEFLTQRNEEYEMVKKN